MMSGNRAVLALKIAAGGFAAAAVVALGFACWPTLKPGRISARAAVEQPVFVVAPAARANPATVSAIPVAMPTVDKASLDQLAIALRKQGLRPSIEGAAQPAPAATATARREVQDCFAHGLVALAKGDIAAARRWLERAAEDGETRAFMALGDAYNPSMLTRLGVLGAPGDSAMARDYYNRAASAGLTGARDRLASLEPGAQ